MSLISKALDCRLQILLDTGAAADGRRVVRTRTFNRVKSTISDQDLFETAAAIIGLQSNTPVAVRRVSSEDYTIE